MSPERRELGQGGVVKPFTLDTLKKKIESLLG